MSGSLRASAAASSYEASYRACAGLLVLAAYRVTSQPGHHRAAIEGAGALLGPAARPLLRRVNAARRFLDQGHTPDSRLVADLAVGYAVSEQAMEHRLVNLEILRQV